jgi:hypothetical protein
MTHAVQPSQTDAIASTLSHAGDGPAAVAFELRFESLFTEGRALSFPCDARGAVDLAALTPRARDNYLRACALQGREYRTPAVRRSDLH